MPGLCYLHLLPRPSGGNIGMAVHSSTGLRDAVYAVAIQVPWTLAGPRLRPREVAACSPPNHPAGRRGKGRSPPSLKTSLSVSSSLIGSRPALTAASATTAVWAGTRTTLGLTIEARRGRPRTPKIFLPSSIPNLGPLYARIMLSRRMTSCKRTLLMAPDRRGFRESRSRPTNITQAARGLSWIRDPVRLPVDCSAPPPPFGWEAMFLRGILLLIEITFFQSGATHLLSKNNLQTAKKYQENPWLTA